MEGGERASSFDEPMRGMAERPEYRKALEEAQALIEREEAVVESAPWFGRTGLDEETERELPRYLRRELGESVFDPGSLKAADLTYLGSFDEGAETVHYWRVPSMRDETYAYVVVGEDQLLTGWGDRQPPGVEAK